MAILKFMVGNLKKRKSYSIVIGILVFLTGLILSVTISTTREATDAYDRAFNNMDGPHLFYWMYEKEYKQEYKDWLEKQSTVKSVKVRNAEYYNGAVFTDKGRKLKEGVNISILEYNPGDNMKLIDAIYSPDKELAKGEIYMPYVYKTGYSVKEGDTVTYEFGANKLDFKVAGFIEEPIMGSDMAGGKLFFVSADDMTEILNTGKGNITQIVQMRIRLKEFSEATVYKLEKDFNKQFDSFSGSVLTYMQTKSDHLIMPKISLITMIGFALILCIITVTILRYAIMATIEADYLDIGIIKALGFTPLMVQGAIIGQYAIIALLSSILSLIAGVFCTPLMRKVVLNSSGLYFNGGLSPLVGILILSVLVLIISLFSYITARRTKKISPARAIANGTAPVYFSSKLALRLERIRFLPFDIRMAVKQVLTKSKRYILLIIISALLTSALIFALGLTQMFKSEKIIYLVGGQLRDIQLNTGTKAEAEKILAKVKEDYDVVWTTFDKTEQLIVDDEKTIVHISDDFDTSGQLSNLEGRHPKHDNEISISVLLKAKFNRGVGQYLTIRDKEGQSHQFLITGVFQTIDHSGEYARMTESGAKALYPQYQLNEAYIRLKNPDNIDSVIKDMKERYSGYEGISNERVQAEDKVNTIKSIVSAFAMLVFILTMILIGFITLLIMKITVYSETKEFGIFKAIGFNSSKIRFQLALRFAMVTVIGGLIGAVLESLTGSKLFSIAFESAGVSKFIISFSFTNILIAIGIITITTMLSAYLVSGNTKRISAYVLINE